MRYRRHSIALAAMTVTIIGFVGVARATHPPGTGKQAIGGSTFCDGRGGPIVGDGSSSQLDVHTQVFGPAFLEECSGGNSTVNLQAMGDENAFNRLADRSREFGAADIPLTTLQKVMLERDYPQLKQRWSEVGQIPLYIDSLGIGYNLQCVPADERLSLRSNVLSQILSGTITAWNHPLVVADNPFLDSCGDSILLVKKNGYSGTTYNLKDYLSKRNPEWNYYKQTDQNTAWPDRAGFVCIGDDEVGMAKCINTNPGALGYLKYAVAVTEQVKVAGIENSSRQFVAPSPEECSKAASTVLTTATVESVDFFNVLPFGTGGDWSTVSLTDSRAGYPLCNFGYVYAFSSWYSAYAAQKGASSLRTLVDYLLVSAGISYSLGEHHRLLSHGYTPLPGNIVNVSIQGIESMRMF